MRVVIDTNVLVSGLMTQGTPPGMVVDELKAQRIVSLYDQRILSEYREVLTRPTLKRIRPQAALDLLEVIVMYGEEVLDARFPHQLSDPGDQPFADVAFTGQAEVLITGNIRHFPIGDLIRVVTPGQWLDLKQSLPGA